MFKPRDLFIIGFLISISIFYVYVYDGTELFTSKIDNKKYKVRRGNDAQFKADLLALINIKLNSIVSSLKNDNSLLLNEDVQRLIRKWDSGISIKEIGNMESDAAYVINKKHMSFCLHEKPNGGSYPDKNLMTYVGIHELSHIMSKETGHGKEFIKNFQFLLNYAKNTNYFDPTIHQWLPVYSPLNNDIENYCGVSLENSIK